MPVPNTFANATTSIPLSQLDANFATAITLGNTSIQLGNTVTTLNNMTLSNVTITTGNVTVSNATVGGNLAFTSTGQRITGDMSNATLANRLMFQTSTANSSTVLGVLPNGSGQVGQVNIFGGSDPANTSFLSILCATSISEARLTSGINGSGTYLPITFYTGGSERARIDSSGNVGIGTTSPGNKLSVVSSTQYAGITLGNGTYTTAELVGFSATNDEGGITFKQAGTTKAQILANGTSFFNGGNVGIGTSSPTDKLQVNTQDGVRLGASGAVSYARIGSANTGESTAQISYDRSTGATIISQGNTGSALNERMRIDNSGNLLVGTTSTLFPSSHAFVSSGDAILGLRNSGATAGKYWQVGPDAGNSFKVYNQNSVGMFMSDGSTSWSSSSDERQKNIIEPISNAVAKVGSLRAVIGSYKSDQENKRRSFLIAQDVEQALPEAVTTAPDGFLGVAYTDVIPLLVAAIQELKADFDAYKAAHP